MFDIEKKEVITYTVLGASSIYQLLHQGVASAENTMWNNDM